MPPAARITDMHVCPMVNPGPVPHVGGPIAMGAPTVFTGKLPQARVGDMAICVGPPDTIAKGSSGVFVTKRPAARLGDNTAHGGVIVAGLPTVIIGETGGGGGGSGSVSAGVSSNGFVGGGLAAVAFAQPPTMAEGMRAAAAAGTPFCEICFQLTSAASQKVQQYIQSEISRLEESALLQRQRDRISGPSKVSVQSKPQSKLGHAGDAQVSATSNPAQVTSNSEAADDPPAHTSTQATDGNNPTSSPYTANIDARMAKSRHEIAKSLSEIVVILGLQFSGGPHSAELAALGFDLKDASELIAIESDSERLGQASLKAIEMIITNLPVIKKLSKAAGIKIEGQLVNIIMHTGIVAGAETTKAYVQGVLWAGNHLGNFIYDSGLYSKISGVFKK